MPLNSKPQYYIALYNMDADHTRANVLFHQCMVLTKLDPLTGHEELIDAYSFNSHDAGHENRVRQGKITSSFNFFRKIGPLRPIIPAFRIEGTYSEFKREEIHYMLMHGATASQKFPITFDELKISEQRIVHLHGERQDHYDSLTDSPMAFFNQEVANYIEIQRQYFKSADMNWLVRVTGKSLDEINDFMEEAESIRSNDGNINPRIKAQTIQDYIDDAIKYFVNEHALDQFRSSQGVDWREVNKIRIDEREAKFHVERDDYISGEFNLCFLSEGQICKTNCLKFLMTLFPVDSAAYLYFKDKLDRVVTRNIPRLTPDMQPCLFTQIVDKNKPLYTEAAHGLIQPQADWQGVNVKLDLSHNAETQRALHTLKQMLMLMAAPWYQENPESKLDPEAIISYLKMIKTLLLCKNAEDFTNKINFFQSDFEILMPAVMEAISIYRNNLASHHTKFPQDVTVEFPRLERFAKSYEKNPKDVEDYGDRSHLLAFQSF